MRRIVVVPMLVIGLVWAVGVPGASASSPAAFFNLYQNQGQVRVQNVSSGTIVLATKSGTTNVQSGGSITLANGSTRTIYPQGDPTCQALLTTAASYSVSVKNNTGDDMWTDGIVLHNGLTRAWTLPTPGSTVQTLNDGSGQNGC
jgi:hypothetical protein